MPARRYAAGKVAGERTDRRARYVSGNGRKVIEETSQANGAGPVRNGSRMRSGRPQNRVRGPWRSRQAASAPGRNARAISAALQMLPSLATSASRSAGFSRGVREEGAGAAPARDWAAAYCRRRAVQRTRPRRACSRGQAAPRPGSRSRRHRALATRRGASRAARASPERSRRRDGRGQARPARSRAAGGRRPIPSAPRSRAAATHSMPGRRAALRSRAPATRAEAQRRSADSDGATGRNGSVAALLCVSREQV